MKAKFVIGLGASAGGLEALELFFDSAPLKSGGAYVVVMHLSRDFKSMLDDILSHHTGMRVVAAKDGMVIEADTVYVIQPATILEVSKGKFRVTNRPTVDPTGLATAVDALFLSMAEHWGANCAAVVLSGSGSDGKKGIVAVHQAGGFTCAQAPETAKFDSMPVSAINTNSIDAVEAPEILAHTAIEGVLLPRLPEAPDIVPEAEAAMSEILAAVVGFSDLDASQYKHSTFDRRVRRRMQDLGIDTLSEYADRLNEDKGEAQKLSDMLLIGVTNFFRDEEAFETIREQVIPDLIRRAQSEKRTIRVWVPGCATGEEAYSLAILFAEASEDLPEKIDFQIFATDVKPAHLTEAGRGEYDTERLNELPRKYRDRYFKRMEGADRWVFDATLRRSIVFAANDVLSDPPFTRLDMISCRNLLIYFSVEAQQDIMAAFAFGLRERGYLFLGSSETVGGSRDAFEFVDAKNRIFRRTGSPRRRARLNAPSARNYASTAGSVRSEQRAREAALQPAYAALLGLYAPPGMLVSEDRQLLHNFGAIRKFISLPEGVARLDVTEMVDPALKTPLIAGMERVRKDGIPVTFSRLKLEEFPEEGMIVDLTIRPVSTVAETIRTVLVLIDIVDDPDAEVEEPSRIVSADSLVSDRISELEMELDRTRDALQATIETLETTNEELQASNEELMSSNEELQSTNEELSSVNEELYSVNSEYHRQNDDLTRLNLNFDLLLRSTQIGVIFLDEKLNITRFTSLAGNLFDIAESDIGRPLERFRSPFPETDPVMLFEEARETNEIVELETEDANGTAWLMRAVLDTDQRYGAVLTLINIGRLREVEVEARRNSEMLTSLQSVTNAFYLEIDPATQKMVRQLGWFQFLGKRSRKLPFKPKWTTFHPADRADLTTRLANGNEEPEFDAVLRIIEKKSGGDRHVRVMGRLSGAGDQKVWQVTGVDVSELVANEQKALEREQVLEGVLRASPSLVSYVDTEQRYVYANHRYLEQWDTTLDALIGRKVSDFLPPETYSEAEPYIKAALSGESCSYILYNRMPDGEEQRLSVVYEPTHDGEGNVTGFAVDVMDVTSHYALANTMADMDRILASATRTSDAAIMLADIESLNVEFATLNAQVRLGIKPGLDLPKGIKLSRLTPEIGDKAWHRWIDDLKTGDDVQRQDVIVFNENQKGVPVDLYIGSADDDGTPKVIVRVIDNTERIAAIDDLRERTRQLAISNRDLEQFASAIAHDLRAPVRHLSQFTSLLADELAGMASGDAQDFMSVIEESARVMSDMVDALLDYARLGRSTRTFKVVDLSSCIRAAKKLLVDEIKDSGATIEVGRMRRPEGDKELITQLFQNLISNSIKYASPDRPPHINIQSEEADGIITIRVEDNGIGIKPAFADRIFALFQRLHAEDAYAGLGVGLATCRRICEMHHGSLTLDTSYEEGACFVITLPRHANRNLAQGRMENGSDNIPVLEHSGS